MAATIFGTLPIWSTYRQASGDGLFVDRFAMVSMFSILGYIVIFFTTFLLTSVSFMFFIEHLWILPIIIFKGFLATLVYGSIVFLFSATTNKKWLASIGVIALVFISEIVTTIVYDMLGKDWVYMLSVEQNLTQVASFIFDVNPPFESEWYYSGIILISIVIVCLSLVYLRIAKTELSE